MNGTTEERSPLGSYLREIRRVPRLDRAQENEVALAVRQGHPDALHTLVRANLGFVVKVAKEFRSMGMPFEDLINEGNIGLMEAATRFDPGKGTKFITYAIWWIRKAILGAIAVQTRIVRLPDGHLKQLRQLRAAEEALRARLRGEPTHEEIARYLAIAPTTVDKVLRNSMHRSEWKRSDAEDPDRALAGLQGDEGAGTEERLIRAETVRAAACAFTRLPRREQQVLALRLGLWGDAPLTLADAGSRLGLSRERIRQIERDATTRLRRLIGR